MIRLFALFLALSFSLSSQAKTFDHDKKLHFGVSAGIGAASQIYTNNQLTSLSVCAAIGLGKEIYDEVDYGGFDKNDLAADALGCLLGVYGVEVAGWSLNVISHNDATILGFSRGF